MSEVPIDTRRAIWTFAGTLARCLVAFIFVYSAVEKVNDLDAFAKSIRGYQIFPQDWTNLVAFVVPWIELVACALLIFGSWRKEARLVIGGLLVLFIALKAVAMARGLDIDCGCVASDSILAPLFNGIWGIVTNVVLIGLLVFDLYCAKRLKAARPVVETQPEAA
jgi:uncharacterized membrane protein YphA (DoxX/SURF4 family)